MAGKADAVKRALATPTVKVEGPGGDLLDVTPEDASAGFLERRYKYVAGEKYFVRDEETGAPVEVDAETAARTTAARPMTAELAAPNEAARLELQREHGGIGAQLATAGEGALDELTFGAAPVVGRGLFGDDYADRRELNEMANPTADTLGRGAGLGVGLLYGAGEAGAASKGAGLATRGARALAAPTRAVLRGGEAAERLGVRAAEALGADGEGLFGRMVGGAARGAGEGGAFGLGAELSREAVEDPDYSAERLLSGAMRGAEAGGLFGAAIPVAGAAASKAGRYAGDKAAELGGRVAAKGRELGGRAVEVGRELGGKALEVGGKVLDEAGEALLGSESKLGQMLEGKAGRAMLDDVATRKAVQATGANQRQLEELLERGPDTVKRVARRLRDEVPASVGKKSLGGGVDHAPMSHAELGEAGARFREASGKELGGFLDELDDVARKVESKRPGTNVRPDVKRIHREAVREVVRPLDSEVFRGPQARQLRELVDDFAAKGEGLSLKDLHAKRANLDDLIFESQRSGARALEDSYRSMRGIIEKELERTGDRIIKYGGMPKEAFGRYRALKEKYADSVWINEATAKGAAAEARNRSMGLSEQFGLAEGLQVGGLAGGAVGAIGQNLARRYGDQVLATTAARAQQIGALPAVREAVKGAVTSIGGSEALRQATALAKGAAELAGQGVKALGQAGAEAAREAGGRALDYTKRTANAGAQSSRRALEPVRGVVDEVDRGRRERVLADNRAAEARVLARRVAAEASPANPGGQRVAAALGARVDAAHRLLSERETPAPGTPVAPQLPESASHTDKIAGRRAALAEPERVLEMAAKGETSADQIRAIKAVYPQLLNEARERVSAELKAATTEPSLANLTAASLVLGRPADPSLRPHVLRAVQASLAKSRAQKNANQQAQQQPAAGRAMPRAVLGRAAAESAGEQTLVGGLR